MGISMIAAMAENRVIGQNNQIPWRAPGEMKHFKEITMGHTLIMGRKTFESIGRPLPGRDTIVVTRDPNFTVEGVTRANSLSQALELADTNKEVFIAGGSEIYRQYLDQVETLYLTVIHIEPEGDAFFPEFDRSQFSLVSEERIETSPSYTCQVYKRNL